METAEPRLAGWTVFLDENGNGVFDRDSGTFDASDVPKPLADNVTSTSTEVVAGLGGQITDVDVTLDIRHRTVGDLKAYLVSPAGTRVTLFEAVGGYGSHFIGTTLDSEADDGFYSFVDVPAGEIAVGEVPQRD